MHQHTHDQIFKMGFFITLFYQNVFLSDFSNFSDWLLLDALIIEKQYLYVVFPIEIQEVEDLFEYEHLQYLQQNSSIHFCIAMSLLRKRNQINYNM